MAAISRKAAFFGAVAVVCAAAFLRHFYAGKSAEKRAAADAKIARAAAEQGDLQAEFKLAGMYARGIGVPQDYAEAARLVRPPAEHGDARAQFDLASMYYYGRGVSRDYAEAAKWYRKAAEQRDAPAEYGLAYLDYLGKGVPQSYDEAFRLFTDAAQQGDRNAQYMLGGMYHRGEGTRRDDAASARWYIQAADQGDIASQAMVAEMYRNGIGVTRSYLQASRWFSRSLLGLYALNPREYGSMLAAILLGLPVVFVRQRRWGRAAWVPSVLLAAMLAIMTALYGSRSSGPMRIGLTVLLAGGSVMFAIAAIVQARKRE